MRIKNILLYGHSGSKNKGCEAIIRGTHSILKEEFPDAKFKLLSNDAGADIKAMGEEGMEIVSSANLNNYSIRRFIFRLTSKSLKLKRLSSYLRHCGDIKQVRWADVGLSVGGDKYCYKHIDDLVFISRHLKKRGKKNILWGCSIEPDTVKNNKTVRDNLRMYDAVFTRESITFNALINEDLNRNVFLYSDPAFVMKPRQIRMPKGWDGENTIGVNLSLLILNHNKNSDVLMLAFIKLVRYILNETFYSIALIPHVMIEKNSDYQILRKIKEKFPDDERVLLVNSTFNAPETKQLISKCEFFIGARTHSVIAAYSSSVPALALGYSVKSMGIARDVFSDWKGYVVPVNDVSNEFDLIQPFINLLEKKVKLKRNCLNRCRIILKVQLMRQKC